MKEKGTHGFGEVHGPQRGKTEKEVRYEAWDPNPHIYQVQTVMR